MLQDKDDVEAPMVNEDHSAPPPIEMREPGPTRISLTSLSGGEVQISEYAPGDRPTIQDEMWQEVAFDDTSGFDYPNTQLSDEDLSNIVRQNASEARRDKVNGDQVAESVHAYMVAIADELNQLQSSVARRAGGRGALGRFVVRRRVAKRA